MSGSVHPSSLALGFNRRRFAKCCAFNRRGSHLAVGSGNGDLVLWDFVTRAEAKIINVHTLDPVPAIVGVRYHWRNKRVNVPNSNSHLW